MRKLGDDDVDAPRALEDGDGKLVPEKSKWVAVSNPEGVVREIKERKVVSREETEEVKETEDIQHLGDITDEVSTTSRQMIIRFVTNLVQIFILF